MSIKHPIAQLSRDAARENMASSNLAVKVEESLKALDTALKYHIRRLNEHGDAIQNAADAFERGDQSWADALNSGR
ncbi:hypothetical protein [Nocardia sp. NPDC060259]|uniref:hypothetical protein n=1 Tax=Nocardia sp. NPDC060259 TaxID=3347088 RepID=UPI0036642D5E